ncbi:MAG: pseudouridine synthase [Crocinitomicaceae bacterium]|nr:pseudouridine synthase [Crocinitomicaceae bacterium]
MNTRKNKSNNRGNDSDKPTFKGRRGESSKKVGRKDSDKPASKGRKGEPSKNVGDNDSDKPTFKGRKGEPGKTVGVKKAKPRDKRRYIDFREKVKKGDPLPSFNDDAIRLNKYLSNAGICSRREADLLIETGLVSVNGEIVTEMGHKVKPDDTVKYDGGTINAEKKQYVLLNKPKGFLTTMDDPMGRKTVMGLVKKACKERVYPVGRLDRDTTGLLLFTNDGDMAKKLTHPKHKASKLYHVELNKKVSIIDLKKTLTGIELEDGTTKFDKAEFVEDADARNVGVELHSGKNRIVRRTFESLGYVVTKLDRVSFSGLTKRDLPRGTYRHLTEKEVAFLKMK